jgi:hypothetical protein
MNLAYTRLRGVEEFDERTIEFQAAVGREVEGAAGAAFPEAGQRHALGLGQVRHMPAQQLGHVSVLERTQGHATAPRTDRWQDSSGGMTDE